MLTWNTANFDLCFNLIHEIGEHNFRCPWQDFTKINNTPKEKKKIFLKVEALFSWNTTGFVWEKNASIRQKCENATNTPIKTEKMHSLEIWATFEQFHLFHYKLYKLFIDFINYIKENQLHHYMVLQQVTISFQSCRYETKAIWWITRTFCWASPSFSVSWLHWSMTCSPIQRQPQDVQVKMTILPKSYFLFFFHILVGPSPQSAINHLYAATQSWVADCNNYLL